MENIINLYKTQGDAEYFGENVSKTTHMIQTAMAAQQNNEPDYLVLACLLHDIGHFLDTDNMNGLGVIEHGKIGADYLRQLNMSECVCVLVENHVMAKKYLVSKNDDYYQKLSSASKQTLEYQGGRMTASEMEEMKKHPNFNNILQVRHYDDIGKQVGMDIPTIDSFIPLINKYLLTPETIEYSRKLKENGFLLLKDYFSIDESQQIIDFKQQLENLEETKGKWMIYYEKNNQRSRIENFINYSPNIKLFIENKISPLIENICQTPMILFKDKLNWKLSQGDGFEAHQDHPAWNDFTISRFYSIALFANNSTIENGCLQVVSGKNNIGEINSNGCIPKEIAEQYQWEYLETTPRDLLIFDSFIPHKSDKNTTDKSRSIFYFTYNKLEEGDHYQKYITHKRQYFPPPIERDNLEIKIENNKYNLGNPIN